MYIHLERSGCARQKETALTKSSIRSRGSEDIASFDILHPENFTPSLGSRGEEILTRIMDLETPSMLNQTLPTLIDPLYVTLFSFSFFTISIFFWWCIRQFRFFKRRAILLVGLAQSGKTLLFARLIYNQYRQTFTSKKENIAKYKTCQKKTWKIIDIPGQEALRYKFFDQFKSYAKAIVFVIDSCTIVNDIKDVAEYLYMILLEPTIRKNAIPVLVLCNKQDMPNAKPLDFIKDLLEKEIQVVRIRKVKQLGVVGSSRSASAVYLGRQHENFRFCHLGCRLDISEASVLTGNDEDTVDLLSLKLWIEML